MVHVLFDAFQDDFPLASLPLLGYSVTMPSDNDDIHKEFVFKLQFKNHVYFFRAESEYTFDRCICICFCICFCIYFCVCFESENRSQSISDQIYSDRQSACKIALAYFFNHAACCFSLFSSVRYAGISCPMIYICAGWPRDYLCQNCNANYTARPLAIQYFKLNALTAVAHVFVAVSNGALLVSSVPPAATRWIEVMSVTACSPQRTRLFSRSDNQLHI